MDGCRKQLRFDYANHKTENNLQRKCNKHYKESQFVKPLINDIDLKLNNNTPNETGKTLLEIIDEIDKACQIINIDTTQQVKVNDI